MNLNASGCYCNSGQCTNCYYTLPPCDSLEGYCQVATIGVPSLGVSCPQLQNSNCVMNDCYTECLTFGKSYDGGWFLSCNDYITVPRPGPIPASICTL